MRTELNDSVTMRKAMVHRPWTIVLFLTLLCCPGSILGQVLDSLEMERVSSVEKLYRQHVKEQRRQDGDLILGGLAATGLGVLLVVIFDTDDPLPDEESSEMVLTGLGLCVIGPGTSLYGIYSVMGEGSLKKKRNFFMRYGIDAKYKGVGPRPGYLSAGVTIHF